MQSRSIGSGVTLPRKLTLERNGVRAHAIFHDVDIEKRRERLRGGAVVNFFRDKFANNVAAFELSRMLGLTNVPPAVVRRIGRDTVESLGFEVDLAADGLEALEKVASTSYVAVIVDLVMPRMDGRDLLARLRERYPNLPVIVASGYVSLLVKRDPEAVRLTRFLRKPLRVGELTSTLVDLLEEKVA